ncbi:hypothetical protein [Sphingobacterium endophyticum]|uniref:hypothetical protein n=1 Tax=Sphingobacterium endophyticum TaxID=2546448 RepID=UPI0012E1103D|nr:hypothetical protein [Sphingobacterium endophyticum]
MSSKNLLNIFLNPFEDIKSNTLLVIGTIGFILLSILGYFFHFINDGIIQIHPSVTKEFWKYLVNGSINTLSLTVILFLYGKMVNNKTRAEDVLIAVLIAQIALIFIVVVSLNPYSTEISQNILQEIEKGNIAHLKIETTSLIILTISGIIGIVFLYYFFHLLVIGMKVAINSKKLSHTIVIVVLTLVLDMILKITYPYL